MAYGAYTLGRAKYHVFPEFEPPQVGIQTEAAGLTPEQVEVLVTRPIESEINGVSGVQTLRSTSIQGLSVVTVFFDPSSDVSRHKSIDVLSGYVRDADLFRDHTGAGLL